MSDEKTYGGLTAYEIRHEHRFGCPHDRGIVIELLDDVATLTAENAALKAHAESQREKLTYWHAEATVRFNELLELKAQLAAAEPAPKFLIENFTRLYGLVDRLAAYPRRREDEVSLETFRDEARTLLEIAGPLERFTAPPQHAVVDETNPPALIAEWEKIADAAIARIKQIGGISYSMDANCFFYLHASDLLRCLEQHAARVPDGMTEIFLLNVAVAVEDRTAGTDEKRKVTAEKLCRFADLLAAPTPPAQEG